MKKLLISIILLVGVQAEGNAQLLKKIGNAVGKGLEKIDKAAEALNKAAGNTNAAATNAAGSKEKMIGQPVKIGQSTLTKYGDNPGIDINWQGLYRIYGNTVVTAYFQLINQGELKASVGIEGSVKNYALDMQGRQYCDWTAINGNRRVGAQSLEPSVKALYTFNYEDVPASVSEMQMLLLGFYSCIGEQGSGHDYTFRINDAPISILPAITAKGIYGQQQVLIGSAIAALPKTFPYLYDAYTVSTEEDEGEIITTITFTSKGQEVMTAISYDSKTIANIDVRTNSVYVKVADRYYTCGTPMSNIKYASGVKREENDYGTIVTYQGMFFDEDVEGNICAIHI